MIFEDFSYDNFGQPIETTDQSGCANGCASCVPVRGGRYKSGLYDQLATMFQGNGNEDHAVTVLIEKQRHRYQAIVSPSKPLLRPGVRLRSLLQRITVSYGYRPLRALLWLLLFAAGGTAWFHFHKLDPINVDDNPVWGPFCIQWTNWGRSLISVMT